MFVITLKLRFTFSLCFSQMSLEVKLACHFPNLSAISTSMTIWCFFLLNSLPCLKAAYYFSFMKNTLFFTKVAFPFSSYPKHCACSSTSIPSKSLEEDLVFVHCVFSIVSTNNAFCIVRTKRKVSEIQVSLFVSQMVLKRHIDFSWYL